LRNERKAMSEIRQSDGANVDTVDRNGATASLSDASGDHQMKQYVMDEPVDVPEESLEQRAFAYRGHTVP
jgi:hypothetical protein